MDGAGGPAQSFSAAFSASPRARWHVAHVSAEGELRKVQSGQAQLPRSNDGTGFFLMTRAVSFSGGGRPSLGGGALPVDLFVMTPVSKMGSLPGGCEGAAGRFALGVGGADRFAGALLPGMWSLWPGGGPGGGPGGAFPLLFVGGGWLGGERCEGVPGGARFRTVTLSGGAMLFVEAGRFSTS